MAGVLRLSKAVLDSHIWQDLRGWALTSTSSAKSPSDHQHEPLDRRCNHMRQVQHSEGGKKRRSPFECLVTVGSVERGIFQPIRLKVIGKEIGIKEEDDHSKKSLL